MNAHRLKWWQERLGESRSRTKVGFIPAEISSIASVVVRLPIGITIEASSAMTLPPAWVSELARALAVKA